MAQSKSQRLCDVCEENPGLYYCYECEQGICKSCRKLHEKVPTLKKHNINLLKDVDRSVRNLSTSCKKHHEEYVHFCENCKCLTCSVCVTSDHKGHLFIDLESISNKERKTLKAQKDNIQSKIQEISKSVDDIKATKLTGIDQYNKEYLQSVEDLTTELNNIIKLVLENEITKAKNFHGTEKQQLESTLAELKNVHTEYSNSLEKIDEFMKEKHNTVFILQSKAIASNIKSFIIPDVPELKKLEPFNTEAFLQTIVKEIQSKHQLRFIQDKEKEVETLKQELEDQESKMEKLQKETETSKKDNDQRIFKLNQEHNREIRKLQTEKARLTKESDDKIEETEKLQKEIDALKKANSPKLMRGDTKSSFDYRHKFKQNTQYRTELLNELAKLKYSGKIKAYWINDGRIYARRYDLSWKALIRTVDDIQELTKDAASQRSAFTLSPNDQLTSPNDKSTFSSYHEKTSEDTTL